MRATAGCIPSQKRGVKHLPRWRPPSDASASLASPIQAGRRSIREHHEVCSMAHLSFRPRSTLYETKWPLPASCRHAPISARGGPRIIWWLEAETCLSSSALQPATWRNQPCLRYRGPKEVSAVSRRLRPQYVRRMYVHTG